jgi:Fur family ferric uptake transcriptional regulator
MFRKTPFRTRILEIFQLNDFALTLEDIEVSLEKFDRITLYRTLKLFQDHGVIHVVNNGNVKKYALCKEACSPEKHHHHHIHFTCDMCQQTKCIESKPFEISLEGYEIKELEVNVNGFCKNCA